jgi:hypothetical protein
MGRFNVEISETFIKVVSIEALSEREAIGQAMEQYQKGEVLVPHEGAADVRFAITRPPAIYIPKA